MHKPKKYVIEIGLDSSTTPRPDGTYPHSLNLIKVKNWNDAKEKAKPAWFTQFKSGDQIVFRICDYSDINFGNPLIEISSFVACFIDPKDRQCLSPCLNEGVVCTGQSYFPIQSGTSLVVDKADGWRFVSSSGSTSEKFWTLTGPSRALLRITIAAIFRYTHEEEPKKGTLQPDKQLRWFTHDPEIIVGEGGPPK